MYRHRGMLGNIYCYASCLPAFMGRPLSMRCRCTRCVTCSCLPLQEMASRGVSLVYQMGDDDTRQRLVASLVGVLQGGAAARAAVKLQGDTQVGEGGGPGALGLI